MTNEQKWVLSYLKGSPWEYISPTEVGRAWSKGYHSSWSCPKLKALVKMGLVKRNSKGLYQYVKDPKP